MSAMTLPATSSRFEAREREYQACLDATFYESARFFYEARRESKEPWFKKEWGNFGRYCENRWQVSRPRGIQLADAFEVVKNLADSAEVADTDLKPFVQQWLGDFNERHARVLKKLLPDQQAEAWNAASDAAEGPPSVGLLETIATEFPQTPAQIQAMSAGEQRSHLVRVERRTRELVTLKAKKEDAALTAKRMRKCIAAWKGSRYEGDKEAAGLLADLESAMAKCQAILSAK